MALTNTPKLAELIDSRIAELRRQGTITAKDIAARAGIKQTTLSMIRKGHRGVSPSVAVRVAEALDLDPSGVLTAAGYAPISSEVSVKPVIFKLRTKDGFLNIVRGLPQGSVVWTFGLGFIEMLDDEFFEVFRTNIDKGVGYLFFVAQRNALDFIKLRDVLRSDGIELDLSRCNAVVVSDESFHHRSPRVFKCLLRLPDGTLRGFASTNEIDGDYLYNELSGSDLADLQFYLDQLDRRSRQGRGNTLPALMFEWLKHKGYKVDLPDQNAPV